MSIPAEAQSLPNARNETFLSPVRHESHILVISLDVLSLPTNAGVCSTQIILSGLNSEGVET
jgi:hypothetical protein